MKTKFSLLLEVLIALAIAAPAQAVFVQRALDGFGCVTGEAVTEAQVIMMKSDGLCYKADADDAALRPALGVAGGKTASGGNLRVITKGQVGGGSSLTKGAAVYLSTTAGGTTQTQPTAFSQPIGRAISATQYVLDVQRSRQIKSITIHVPDPGGADADLTAGYVLWKPTMAVTITKVWHIPQAAWIAAAALGVGSANDMGAITNGSVAAGASVTIGITTNGTANAPASAIQIEYIETGE
jgi:hypothetical protein